jgi:type II restriction enzyme
MRQQIIDLIFKIAKEKDAFNTLENQLIKITKKQLTDNIIECGILPEMFSHDSSEEKLWAKYSDIVLALSLKNLGIDAKVLGARGNSADVYGETKQYTIVGDAKTFRLSRTAKNQKDFKISALDSWRKGNNYAMLLSPLSQYPTRASQIYAQAIEKNVTLISYTHIYFLIDNFKNQDLQQIWETGNRLKSKFKNTELTSSELYWNAIDEIVCSVCGKQINDLEPYKQLEIDKTKEIGNEGITYWRNKINEFNKLSKADAVRLLIKSEKIEAKIKTIEKAIKIIKL